MTCGYKIMIRCDKLGDFSDLMDDAWEDVKYSNNTEEILKLFTGVIRLQAGIQGMDLRLILKGFRVKTPLQPIVYTDLNQTSRKNP